MTASARVLVLLCGKLAGYLTHDDYNRASFSYSEDWLNYAAAIPLSVSIPLNNSVHQGDAIDYFLKNLLSDNAEARQRISQRFHVHRV